MSQALASPANCCDPCPDQVSTQIPGPAGADGTNGTNGTDGINAFTDLAAAFAVPDAAVPASATVDNSDWAVVGQIVFLEGAGYFTVTSVPDSTHVVLDNTDYPGNAADGTVIAIGSHLGPGGLRGEAGAAGGGGDLLSANNLNDVADADASLTNLGGSVVGTSVFKVADPSAIRFLRVNANNTVNLLSDADQRTALGLAIGTNVQAFDAFLASIAALGTAADRMLYTTGVDTAAETPLTALARTFLTQASAAAQRVVLGRVLPRYGLIGVLHQVNFNAAATDHAVTIEPARYVIDRIIVDNPSTNMTTATVGVFNGAGGTGDTIAPNQAVTQLSSVDKFADLTLGAVTATDVFTDAGLLIRTGTPQGAPAEASVWIFGYHLYP